MNKEEIILRGIDEIPMFTFNTKTKEFSVLGHKFEGVNSIEDFINYIHNLGKENKELKEKVNQLESTLNEIIDWKDKNGNRYIYQDSLGEDWYFYDLDVFDELGEILDKVGDSNE